MSRTVASPVSAVSRSMIARSSELAGTSPISDRSSLLRIASTRKTGATMTVLRTTSNVSLILEESTTLPATCNARMRADSSGAMPDRCTRRPSVCTSTHASPAASKAVFSSRVLVRSMKPAITIANTAAKSAATRKAPVVESVRREGLCMYQPLSARTRRNRSPGVLQSDEKRGGENQHNDQPGIAVRAEEPQADIIVVDIELAQLPVQMRAERPGPGERQRHHQRIGPWRQRVDDRQRHQHHRRHQKAAQPVFAVVAKEPRGGFHPDQRIILAVLMGVDRIIKERPGDAGQIEQHRRPAQRAGL